MTNQGSDRQTSSSDKKEANLGQHEASEEKARDKKLGEMGERAQSGKQGKRE